MIKVLRNVFFLLLFAGVLFSCKSQNTVSNTERIPEDSTLTGIERGPCFGRCPEYKAVIYVTGFAEYYGRRNTDKLGYFQAKLSPQQLADVKTLMTRYNMDLADSAYVNPYIADYPAYFLMVRDSRGSRQVLVNHEDPPVNIREFTFELDKMLPSFPWVEVTRRDDR
jgi:hypothetical protein